MSSSSLSEGMDGKPLTADEFFSEAPSLPATGWFLSLIVLAYNEEECLEENVRAVASRLDQVCPRYEILIVNDGSRDQTGRVAERCARDLPGCRVIHHEHNRGFGAACMTGIRAARGNAIAWMCADTCWPLKTLHRALSELEEVDAVVTVNSAQASRPWYRRWISSLYTGCLQQLSKQRLRYFNGASCIRVEALKSLALSSRGFTFWAEVVVQLSDQGKQVREVEGAFPERRTGRSKAFSLFNIKETLAFFGRMMRRRWTWRL